MEPFAAAAVPPPPLEPVPPAAPQGAAASLKPGGQPATQQVKPLASAGPGARYKIRRVLKIGAYPAIPLIFGLGALLPTEVAAVWLAVCLICFFGLLGTGRGRGGGSGGSGGCSSCSSCGGGG